ncbi:MAG: hypothetical protein IT444_00565 [Phycisphaeraceae bacterium]|nr:hypothetical protein [Phycisphaeraceae bacterium]
MMRFFNLTRRIAAAAVIGTLLCAASSVRADAVTDTFLNTWKDAIDRPGDAADLWRDFAEKHKGHDLAAAARLRYGTELLKTAQNTEALQEFTAVMTLPDKADASRQALAESAKPLVARAKMAVLAEKLKEYYASKVEYPATLDELVAAKYAKAEDVTDPYGRRFSYEAKSRRIMPDIQRQVFTLKCDTISATNADLAATLEKAAAPLQGIVLSSTEPAEGKAFLKRPRPDGALGAAQRVSVGETVGDATLLVVTDNYVVLGWKGFPTVVVKEPK